MGNGVPENHTVDPTVYHRRERAEIRLCFSYNMGNGMPENQAAYRTVYQRLKCVTENQCIPYRCVPENQAVDPTVSHRMERLLEIRLFSHTTE
jgi:hypothetical protein